MFIIKIFVLYLGMFNTKTNIMTLRFGKYKGQQLENTPKSYQDWLMNQEWFKAPKKEIPLHRQSLNGKTIQENTMGIFLLCLCLLRLSISNHNT